MRKCSCVAMILAGGQGSRLGALTKTIAKPAVPFGGKYRIIDFALSNCANSGITTVGVLTQYQPLELNTYIAGGQPWDMDRVNGGVFVLPPYMQGKTGEWYKGTANAIYQNIRFVDQFSPDNVLILSGDHIYKMDYGEMQAFHDEHQADLTIAVFKVPIAEASRYGILSAESDGRIYDFAEKPEKPKSDLASMGIYIFRWDALKRYLEQDEADPASTNDFGKDIIPKMLADGRGVYAFTFNGYWKDVGTIESLYDSNMDMLGDPPVLNLYGDSEKIYARHVNLPPQFVSPEADITCSCVTEGCKVYGTVKGSILYSGVTVERGALVENSIVMPFSTISSGAKVLGSIVAGKCVVGQDAVIGSDEPNVALPHDKLCTRGLTLVADGVTVGRGVKVGKGVTVGEDIPDMKGEA